MRLCRPRELAEKGSGMRVLFNVFKDIDREINEHLLNVRA
jgi:hypothetical protein